MSPITFGFAVDSVQLLIFYSRERLGAHLTQHSLRRRQTNEGDAEKHELPVRGAAFPRTLPISAGRTGGRSRAELPWSRFEDCARDCTLIPDDVHVPLVDAFERRHPAPTIGTRRTSTRPTVPVVLSHGHSAFVDRNVTAGEISDRVCVPPNTVSYNTVFTL